MAAFLVEILVRPRPGVMDPQAEAIGESLTSLGYRGVAVEWVGRQLTMTLEAPDASEARQTAEEMCDRILVNPNLEAYSMQVTSAGNGSG